MVHLDRIYTRSGDAGQTGLGDGTRVQKTNPRIAAYGGVDELNSVIGVALTVNYRDINVTSAGAEDSLSVEWLHWLRQVQNDLFDLGADLCVPQGSADAVTTDTSDTPAPLRVTSEQVCKLEQWIDTANELLEPLTSFVLPGGTSAAAQLHHARAVCRRVEIAVLRLGETEAVNPQATIYLNRLSDLLFVLARVCNRNGQADLLWRPGG